MAIPVLLALTIVLGSSLAWDGFGLQGNVARILSQVEDGWLDDDPADDARDDADDTMEALGVDDDALFIQATADETGLSRAAVVSALRDGRTLADVAAAHGASNQAIIARARSRFEVDLEKAVAIGDLSREQADAALADFGAEAREELQEVEDDVLDDDVAIDDDALLMQATAELTGLTPGEVLAALRDGQSLAEIARDHGHTAGVLIAVAQAHLDGYLEEAVAAGKLTEEQSDTLRSAFDSEALIEVHEVND